jgi:hypothetical protein
MARTKRPSKGDSCGRKLGRKGGLATARKYRRGRFKRR